MVREKDALRHKARTTDAAMSDQEDDVSLSDSYDSQNESDGSMNSDEYKNHSQKKNDSLKAKAVKKIKQALEGSDDEVDSE